MIPDIKILTGDCRELLATLPDESVQCCVTSPPYWALRSYLPNDHEDKAREIGLEKTPEAFVQTMVEVFHEVRRVLKQDGTLWLNLGDSYATGAGGVGECPGGGKQGESWKMRGAMTPPNRMKLPGLKPKDLCGIPWMVAFALRADGWWLRSDIIWAKKNCMPESVTDRPTKSHEYIFLLSKSADYHYDAAAIAEPCVSDHDSGNGFAGRQGGAAHLPMGGGTGTKQKWTRKQAGKWASEDAQSSGHRIIANVAEARGNGGAHDSPFGSTRNKRSVWTVGTQPYPEAHFATFPPDLIKPCILAGCPAGGTVLDPFGGSGTTGQVALELGRSAILIELNHDYAKLAEKRTDVTPGFNFPLDP